MRQTAKRIHPPYLWSGGRRRLADSVAAFVPSYFGRFVDPAVTSGAAAIAVMQSRADVSYQVSSVDAGLINVWRVVQADVEALVERVQEHVGRSSARYFAEVRDAGQVRAAQTRDAAQPAGLDVEGAARFVYLCGVAQGGGEVASREGFRSAEFSARVIAFDAVNVRRLAALLGERQASFTVQGAFDALPGIREDDFVFFDARMDARRELVALVKSINAKGAQLLLPDPVQSGDREWLATVEGLTRVEEAPGVDAVWVNRTLRRALG